MCILVSLYLVYMSKRDTNNFIFMCAKFWVKLRLKSIKIDINTSQIWDIGPFLFVLVFVIFTET